MLAAHLTFSVPSKDSWGVGSVVEDLAKHLNSRSSVESFAHSPVQVASLGGLLFLLPCLLDFDLCVINVYHFIPLLT